MVIPCSVRAAAQRGDVRAVAEWLDTGSRDLNEQDGGWTLLCDAADHGACGVMGLLLARGAHTGPGDRYDATALHHAARYGQCAAARLLLDGWGADVNARTTYQATPLAWAVAARACEGRGEEMVAMMRLLYSRGATSAVMSHVARGVPILAATDVAAIARRFHAADSPAVCLLAGVRAAGSWRGFVLEPRRRLLSLKILCERGRAVAFGSHMVRYSPWQRAELRRLGLPARAPLRARLFSEAFPTELFWLVLVFWRADRDSRY
jgi:hypothetical protein